MTIQSGIFLVSAAFAGGGPPRQSPPMPQQLPRPAAAVDSAMLGAWCGSARINVNWTVQRTLDAQVDIAADGRARGTVGDAKLVDGVFRSNRNAAERALHVKTDWIIEGKLDGEIIAAEHITRNSVKIPLNWVPADSGSQFRGGLNTSGTSFGGAGSMVLAASRLVLTRCSRPPRPAP